MSYYIAYRYSGDHLYEVASKAELTELAGRYATVRKMSGIEAHRWVRAGGLHSTSLYVDMDGRIRKAVAERDQ